ncbi:uncharacterized protein LOC120007472 [Tripterygium wilfordii]|uniref:uncharacterized protein LOC120007472 n=1 Tax=Tripterygium wilfordii TaxID=458696 RepID=UPI0018F84E1C|nr:uncharacterized protein LOC120007472 [Tripterygium wilfordii]
MASQEETKQKMIEKAPVVTQEALIMAVNKFNGSNNNGSSNNGGSKPFYKNNQNKREAQGTSKFQQGNKDSQFCNYCKLTNHTIDKCFKLNGFPNQPTKKPRYNNQNHNFTKPSVNQVGKDNGQKMTMEFIEDQYHQIINLLQNKGTHSDESTVKQSQAASVSGHSHFGEDWLGNEA